MRNNAGCCSPDSIILECSSGNTGIALAMVGAALGYRVTILMSASASEERRKLIRQLGAELILFDSGGPIKPALKFRAKWRRRTPRYFLHAPV